jgi:deazaflavin-dependent oxidoreductase (nitroreductase family)
MFAIVYHQGRHSGNRYSTPINIFPSNGGFVIALTYGSDVDWVKNVMAAAGGVVRHRSQMIRVAEPRLISSDEGMAAMPRLVRFILRTINVTEFLRVERLR